MKFDAEWDENAVDISTEVNAIMAMANILYGAFTPDEYRKGTEGRWGAGLPGKSDMQLLFVQSAVAKLKPTGRAAIIENGSPLFTGGAASGESAIRQWLLDNDLLEAIVQLPNDLFYNTGITTYVWVIAKDKAPKRKGKVALINASAMCVKLRKSLGNKRVEISPEMRLKAVKLYEDFKYREYTVMQPLQRSYAFAAERIEDLAAYRKSLIYECVTGKREVA